MQMIFTPFLAVALLATIVDGRRPSLNELLKRTNDWRGNEPKKVEEFTGRAMTADGQNQTVKKYNEARALDLKLRTLGVRAIGDVAEHLVFPTALQQVMVDLHNSLRASVKPRAIDMETMTWDDGVAQYAADWAQCGKLFLRHRMGANRIRRYGENLYAFWSDASNTASLEEHIKIGVNAWWNENEHYNYDGTSCEAGKVCGHYTQMAWATSNTIGCGYALNCPIGGRPTRSFYIVCNYSPPGNYIGKKPYEIE